MKNKGLVVVAMSGGVDSSVSAAILKKQGYKVIGITMCFNLADPGGGKHPSCCGRQGIEDARRVAHKLDIKHYVLNMQKDLEKSVIDDFCREYLRGRTPNPCIRCNQFLKFDRLLQKTIALDGQYLATGHYARIAKASSGFALKKAKDKHKDQSYFLYRISRQHLSRILFPIGGYTKVQVRQLAQEFALPVADKLDSQEICFLPDSDYRGFLKKRLNLPAVSGQIIDTSGKVLGEHKGIPFYTIGQREGLGIAMGYPVYVTKIDPKHNRIIVGKKEEAFASEFLVTQPHFILKPLKHKVALKVKIRYNHQEEPAVLDLSGKRLRIAFLKPQFAITPGQSAVFYQQDKVIGGGIIERVLS